MATLDPSDVIIACMVLTIYIWTYVINGEQKDAKKKQQERTNLDAPFALVLLLKRWVNLAHAA